MGKLYEKNGDIWGIDEFGTKRKYREIIDCKCGNYVDVWGAIEAGRVFSDYWAIKCKKCGRKNAVIESKISII